MFICFQLELSWHGSDPESDIYNYEIGISSTEKGEPDVLPFMSTHAHRHFNKYHPGLVDDQTVYVHIKAINRAGLITTKV